VILDDNGFVAEIRDLTVIHQDETLHLYNVRFEAGSAYEIYGETLQFDFPVGAPLGRAIGRSTWWTRSVDEDSLLVRSCLRG
jgi:hypothetical protein